MALNKCPFLHSSKNLDDFFFTPTPFLPSVLTADPIFDVMPRTMTDRRCGSGAFHPSMSSMFPAWSSSLSSGYDIREFKDKYQIQVDLPGIRASDMNVELEHDGRVLHISCSRKRETEDEHRNISFSEMTRFDKRFTVGDNVETKKMTGNLADGVLTLVAPKKKIKEKKTTVTKIPIKEDKEKKTALSRLKMIQSKM